MSPYIKILENLVFTKANKSGYKSITFPIHQRRNKANPIALTQQKHTQTQAQCHYTFLTQKHTHKPHQST